jgi:CheY-like chemotaxis protein
MPSILLIDDDDTMRLTLCRSLERAGYETHATGNGRAALKCLREAPVDLILTDILMPEMEGIELILSLRRSHPALPIIAMSGGGSGHAGRVSPAIPGQRRDEHLGQAVRDRATARGGICAGGRAGSNR